MHGVYGDLWKVAAVAETRGLFYGPQRIYICVCVHHNGYIVFLKNSTFEGRDTERLDE